jgi:hypothetical protein
MLAQPKNARSSDCQLQKHIRAIGADGTFDVDTSQLATDSKRPARRAGISAQDEASVMSEIGRFTQSFDRRWVWPPARSGRRRSRCRNRQIRRRTREACLDPRGRYPARHVSTLLVRSIVCRSRRERDAGRLEQSVRRLLDHREMAPSRVQNGLDPDSTEGAINLTYALP